MKRYIDDCFASSFEDGGSKNRALVRALAWRQWGILGMIAYGKYSAHKNCTTGDLFLEEDRTHLNFITEFTASSFQFTIFVVSCCHHILLVVRYIQRAQGSNHTSSGGLQGDNNNRKLTRSSSINVVAVSDVRVQL